MPRVFNQKIKILYLMRVFLERTDEEHPMSVKELIIYLNSLGISAERKTVYDDIETLRNFGMDILNRREQPAGFYLASRKFELPELKLLVDAVQSSRFITSGKSRQLIGKLESLASVHEARQLRRQVFVQNRVRTMNESVYYSIDEIQRALTGFAAGVMVAASIWSLLLPAIEQSSGLGKLSFVPAAVGFWIGVLFLLLLDHMIPHLHQNSDKAEGPKSRLQRTTMLVLAVTLHNIPEGMAVGVVYAGYLTGHAQITIMGAMALSIGIAIQNFPEGAIISMPLRSEGMGKTKAFAGGVLSGIVEPVGAVLTILAAGLIVPALPYLLSFAAGAMLYVVVEELIPEMSAGEHSNIGTLFFAIGFSLMMILDVALG